MLSTRPINTKLAQLKKSDSTDSLNSNSENLSTSPSSFTSSSSETIAPTLKYKPMPETGDCAVSPVITEPDQEVTGYYTGNPLATFTTAALIPRLQKSKAIANSSSKPAEFNFQVAGRFHALNRWSLLKITPSKKEKKKSEKNTTLYRFSLLPQISGIEARQLGDDIANTWTSQNRTFLGHGAEEALQMTGQLQETISERRIKIISPKNIDLYAKFHQPRLEDGKTALVVNVRHFHELFKTNPERAAEYFAKIIAYYRHGQALIQATPDNIEKLLQDTGLSQTTFKDLQTNIGIASMPALSQEAVDFLIEDLEVDPQNFKRQLERYENELKNPASTDKKTEQDKLAVFAYAKVFLAVDVFFGKKVTPLIEMIREQGIIINPEETNPNKIKKITDLIKINQLICQDYHAKTLFAFADAVGFCFFPNNEVLYACPTAMDKIQPQMIDLIRSLFEIKIKFPVEYEENHVRERSTSEESANSSGSSSRSLQTSRLNSTIIDSNTTNNNVLPVDHAAMLEEFKTYAYDAMVEACSPKGFYNVYLALGMLNKIIDWYKIAIIALTKTDISLTQEDVLSVNTSFWRSIQKIAEQFKEQNYPGCNPSSSKEAQWLDNVIATAKMHLGDPNGKYAQATVFATTTNMDAWSRHIKEQRYVNNGKDVQFNIADNVPYERNAAFEDNVAKAHAQFAYFSISKEHRKHATTLTALEKITDSFGSLLETSKPYPILKK